MADHDTSTAEAPKPAAFSYSAAICAVVTIAISLLGLIGTFGAFDVVLNEINKYALWVATHYQWFLGAFTFTAAIAVAVRYKLTPQALFASVVAAVSVFWYGVLVLNWFTWINFSALYAAIFLFGITSVAFCFSKREKVERVFWFCSYACALHAAAVVVVMLFVAVEHDYRIWNHYDLSVPEYRKVTQ